MQNDGNKHLSEAEQRNEQASSKLMNAGGGLLKSLFNVVSSKSGDAHAVLEKFIGILGDSLNILSSAIEKYYAVSFLELAKKQNNTPFVNDIDKVISKWYDDNPDMQQYACPEFRKPEYPKFINKPF